MAGLYGGGSQVGVAQSATISPGAGSAGSAGAGGGGLFALSSIANAIVGVVQAIETGRVQKAQANYNAAIIEGQQKWLDWQKQIEGAQYDRARGQFIAKSINTVAGANLMPSGSPMAVLLDSVTQINIDKAIAQANIQQQVEYKKSEAQMQKVSGKNAVRNSYTNAFTEVLSGASGYAMYKSGAYDLSLGAKRAGRQT